MNKSDGGINIERGRERSPIGKNLDRSEDDSNLSNNKEKDRERARRGDRPSRFSPRSSSANRGGDKDRLRPARKATSDRRIYVSNIAYEYKWQELKDLFRAEVGEVTYVELFVDENDKPRGCGIVEFESPESVKIAVEKMHRYDLDGRKLVVKEDFGVERDRFGRPIKGGGGGGQNVNNNINRMRDEPRARWDDRSHNVSQFPSLLQGGGASGGGAVAGGQTSKWGNTYGLSPEFLESLWITSPLVNKVFVANLDYKVDEKKLREVFKLAGKVANAEISVDKEGKSRGFGVVEYEHPVEAVQAISMLNNQVLYDRKIAVRMDRADPKSDLPAKLPEGLRGIGMGLGAGGAPLQNVARNLPSEQQLSLVGAVAGGASGLGAGIGAASALTNVVNPANLGLGNSAGLSAGLAGVGGLGGAGSLMGAGGSLMGTGGSLMGAGGTDIGLGSGLGTGGPFGSSGIGAAASSLGGGIGGSNSYGGNLGGAPSNTYLGGGGSGFGNNPASLISGGNRDFDTLSAALGGGGGGAYGSGVSARDFRGSGSEPGYANGPSRGMGMGGNSSVDHRSSDTILIKNLPPSATWQALRDKFNEVGDVKFAEIRGKDIGLVRFSSEIEAERAVHMTDRTRLDGRIIEVCLFPAAR